MLKRTIKFFIYCLGIVICGCDGGERAPSLQEIQHQQDSLSEARIDSAYTAINNNCDTLMVHLVPQLVDSFLKDTALPRSYFETLQPYHDTDKKAEKVIRQLQADCDSSLLKETYKRARLRQKAKPVQHKRQKV